MKIIIIDEMHPLITDKLREAGHEVTYLPDIAENNIEKEIREYEGIILRSKIFVDESLLKNCQQLKFVARAGAGTDNIDMKYLFRRNILLFNAPEGNRDAVGDHTVGLILGLTNNLLKGNEEIRIGKWDREGNRGMELNAMTIGIIGMGNTGTAVASRLQAFNCKILAYDKYKDSTDCPGVEMCRMEDIFYSAQIITFHVPLTYETNYLINDSYIRKFRNPFYLINTSRGKIAENQALVKYLQSGKLLGLGLDVLENEDINSMNSEEKKNFQILSEHPKVIISPHVAGWTVESYKRISMVLAEKITARFS